MARVWISPCLIYIYMYLVSNLVIGSSSYVTTHGGSWMDISTNCTLATPDIFYYLDNNTINLGPGLRMNQGDKLWVGYTEDLEVFRYIGCVPIDSYSTAIVDNIEVKKDVGLCFSACSKYRYKFIGVTELDESYISCKCVTSFHEADVQVCATGESDVDFPYGPPSLMSLYTSVPRGTSNVLKDLPSWNESTNNCLFSHVPHTNELRWRKCSVSGYFLCTSEINGKIARNSNQASQWKVAADICIRNGTYLLSYQPNITMNSTSRPWLANIRSRVISAEKAPSFSLYQRYGYIEMTEEDTFTLKFGEATGPYKGLCLNKDSETIESTDAGNNVGIYIGVPVAIILVIAASVAVAVYLKQRRKSPADKGVQHPGGNLTNGYSVSKTTTIISKDDVNVYNEIDLNDPAADGYDGIEETNVGQQKSSNNGNHHYLTLEKDYQSSGSKYVRNNGYSYANDTGVAMTEGAIRHDYDYAKEPKPPLSGSTGYVLATETISDVPIRIKGKRCETPDHTEGTEHVYNKAGVETKVNTDYDHITRGHVGTGIAASENEYDTTSHTNISRDGDNDYDTTSKVKMNSDPTYDHT